MSRAESSRSLEGGWGGDSLFAGGAVVPSIISSAFTRVKSMLHTAIHGLQPEIPEDHGANTAEVTKELMKELPIVSCIVRARIPT